MLNETIIKDYQLIAGSAKVEKCKDANEESNLNRSLSGGNLAFSRTEKTKFVDSETLKVTNEINGQARTYGAFAAETESGKKLLISANSITRRLYTEDGSAVHEVFQIKNVKDFGDTPKEIVTNVIAKGLGIECVGMQPLYSPRFVNGQAIYEGMVQRNFPIYEIK